MRREELEKLLGGYAAGTLTPEERRALLEAAVSDQALFDALANEEPLRDALEDPACRARVLEALGPPARGWSGRFTDWLARPQAWALAASVAGAVVLSVAVLRPGRAPQSPPPQQVAALHRAKHTAPAPSQVEVEVEKPRAAAPPVASRPAAPPPARDAETQPAPAKMPAEVPPTTSESVSVQAESQALESEPRAQAAAGVAAGTPSKGEALATAEMEQKAPAHEDLLAKAPAAAPARKPEAVFAAERPAPLPAPLAAVLSDPNARTLFFGGTGRAAQPVGAALARQASDASARSKQAQETLGLRYILERRDAEGRYFEVPADTVLEPDEGARLRLESNSAGFLYVFTDAATLYSGAVAARQPVTIDARPGVLHVILTRQRDAGPAATIEARTRAQLANVSLRSNAPAQAGPYDPAVYIVNLSDTPDARVLTDIRLAFR